MAPATDMFGKTAEQLHEGVDEYVFSKSISLNFHVSALIDDQSTHKGRRRLVLYGHSNQEGRGITLWGH